LPGLFAAFNMASHSGGGQAMKKVNLEGTVPHHFMLLLKKK